MSNTHSSLDLIVVNLDFFIDTEESNGGEEPVIRLRCKNDANENIFLHVYGFYPYFYIDDTPRANSLIQRILPNEKEFGQWIKDHQPHSKRTYYRHRPIYLTKIKGRNPWGIAKYSSVLHNKGIKCYENDIPFVARFLIDTGIKTYNAITVNNFQFIEESPHGEIYKVDYEDIEVTLDQISEYTPSVLALRIFVDCIDEGKHLSLNTVLKYGKQRIIGASICWGQQRSVEGTKTFLLTEDKDNAEKELILSFIQTIHDISPDIIVTFNGNNFDFAYLIKRMSKLYLNNNLMSLYEAKIKKPTIFYGYRIPGYTFYDLLRRSRSVKTRSGKISLTDYAFEFLHVNRKYNPFLVNQKWHTAMDQEKSAVLDKLKVAIDEDAQLIFSLFYEMGTEEWLEIVKYVGIRPSKGIYGTARHLGEFQILRNLYTKGTLIPPEPSAETRKIRARNRPQAVGGFVMTPKGSLHEAVLIADFRSMFPSIMVQYNIGGESFKGITYPPEERFHSEPTTAIKMMEKHILEKRKTIKKDIFELEAYLNAFSDSIEKKRLKDKLKLLKQRSSALKIVANSTYGAHNYVGSRFFNTDISNTITHLSRLYLDKITRWTKQCSDGKAEVVYGDTDSVFIKLADKEPVLNLIYQLKNGKTFSLQDVPEGKELLDFYTDELPENIDIDLVDIALRIIFAPKTKKRYAYLSAITGELVIVGFEAIRSDTSPLAAKVQRLALQRILSDGIYLGAKKVVIKTLLDFLKSDNDKEHLLDDITIYGPVKKDPSKYKNKTPAYVALEHFAREKNKSFREVWADYQRFPYVITKGKGAISSRARHPNLVNLDEIDKEYYIKETLRIVQRINLDITRQHLDVKSKKLQWDQF